MFKKILGIFGRKSSLAERIGFVERKFKVYDDILMKFIFSLNSLSQNVGRNGELSLTYNDLISIFSHLKIISDKIRMEIEKRENKNEFVLRKFNKIKDLNLFLEEVLSTFRSFREHKNSILNAYEYYNVSEIKNNEFKRLLGSLLVTSQNVPQSNVGRYIPPNNQEEIDKSSSGKFF